ncbi:MAG: tetratricopeptide repeat protein [Cyclobacteriaceae bacterium]
MNYSNKKRITLSVLALFIGTVTVFGQAAEWQKLQYQAYLNQNVSLWHQSFKLATAVNDPLTTGLAGYGILNASLPLQNEDLFDEYLDDTTAPLEEVIDTEGVGSGEAKAIMSGILGLRIAFSPMKGMFLGAKSGKYADEAIKEASDSYMAWKLHGNYKFYTPGAFGGDIKEAAEALEKSIALMEQDPTLTKDNWMYIDAIAHLGQAYVQLEQPDKAKAAYEKALKVEPNYMWVSKVLMPKLQAQ